MTGRVEFYMRLDDQDPVVVARCPGTLTEVAATYADLARKYGEKAHARMRRVFDGMVDGLDLDGDAA